MEKQVAAAARWRLCVHAEGARGIRAASGVMTFDSKPDPYVVFVFNGVTKQCEYVQDVPPIEYFAWPNAVVEFDVFDEAILLQTALVVHVKDSDTLKDRYIGGTSIPLAPLCAGTQGDPRVLCQSKFFALEFEDEKLKKRKLSGEVKLTMTVIDTTKKPAPESMVAAVKKPVPKENDAKAESVTKTPPTEKTPVASAPAEPKKAVAAIEPAKLPDPVAERKPSATPMAVTTEASQRTSQPDITEKTATDVQNKLSATSGILDKDVETSGSRNDESPTTSTVHAIKVNVKTLKVELVSARNLSRPVSVGALFDRKPDPMVVIELYGQTKASVTLKDVDLKKPVEWTDAVLAFDLPHTPPPSSKRKGYSPLDLVIHVKDENMMKATYMGGGKMDMGEYFEVRTEATGWCWQSSSTFVETVQERILVLTHSDEKLSKKKACGEITVRFHFEPEQTEVPLPCDESQKAGTIQVMEPLPGPVAIESESSKQATSQNESPVSVTPEVPSTPKSLRHSDIKMLSIELLSGRGLSKPSAGNLAKSMLKSLFDRKPDPYAVMVLGNQIRKCPAVNDVDIAFFEWKNAVQVFEFTSKPYPDVLILHVRDDDIAGSDPYMGGSRILFKEIWNEVFARATCDPPGDPQLVKTYPLTFTDEKLTKQKDCGFVTVRFRWIISDVELPVVEISEASTSSSTAPTNAIEPLEPVPALKSRTGFVYLRKMALYSVAQALDSSLDLYIEASCPSIHDARFAKKEPNPPPYTIKSSVLTGATKGQGDVQTIKIEWIDDELIIPVCVPLDGENPNDIEILIELKDKNAVMKDIEIATKRVRLKDFATSFPDNQPVSVTFELDPQSKSTKNILKFEVEIQFLAHDSPFLSATSPEHHGGIVTLYLLRSVLSTPASPTTKEPPLNAVSLKLEINCLATKKTGLMTFGKSTVSEFQSPSLTASDFGNNGHFVIGWWSTCNFAVSSKQSITAKEKEAFVIELGVRMKSGKTEKVIGSLHLNAFAAAFTSSSVIHSETIQFGAIGSMQLEFVAAFRSVADKATAATKKSPKPVAPPVPSGYLHLLILHATSLVSPDPKDEKVEDLDPEVRVSIEPKYIKRKENPVRSMLKTKPLENAGAIPTWNEYLRLEYQLPPAPPPLPNAGLDQRRVSEAENPVKYPPPIVQIGVFDIQMPGEKHGVQSIGKMELPLSAFLLGVSATGEAPTVSAVESIQLSLDIYLAEKKTGVLVVEGVFEPALSEFKAPVDDPAEIYRQRCRSSGRELRDRSKKLKLGEMNMTTASLLTGTARKRGVAGRLEVHLVGFRGGQSNRASEDRGMSAHLWMSSSIDDRREVKSKLRATEEGGADECQVVWDERLTLYTNDIATEMLRSEVLTLTGQPIGTLKLPLGGLLERGYGGRAQKEWYALVEFTPSSAKKSTTSSKAKSVRPDEVLLELNFFADQVVFDPLVVSTGIETDSSVVVAIHCGKVIVLDGDPQGAAEIACKCSLLGDTTSATTNGKSQSAMERTGFKVCTDVVGIDSKYLATLCWSEHIKLAVGRSAHAYITQSFARGAQPAVRFELLTKRPGARFQETLASLTLSLVSVLHFPSRKATRWLKMCAESKMTDGSDARLGALLEVEIAVFCSTTAIFSALKEEKLLRQAFEDMPQLAAVPGVVCLRFLTGRNLADVDANGAQDPYIIAKIIPRSSLSTTFQSACQTGVSLNGGRHPTWNTSIFELRAQDLLTDYIRLEVIDSNEEDHLPDAYIGAIDIALVSLFREHVTTPKDEDTIVWDQPKTRWLEAWVPIYPVTPAGAHDGYDSDGSTGEIRMEFRFLTEEYYDSVGRQQGEANEVSSPYSSIDLVTNPAQGTLCLHIAQAFDLPCTTGVQPGVRIASHRDGGSYVTKPGKKSIVDPMWDNEVMELSWPPHTMVGDCLAYLIKIEVVDLAVRTANTNALAVIAFGQLDVSSFLAHPLARSYHVYPLHGREPPGKGEHAPSLVIGCQFVPAGKEKEAVVASQQREKREETRSGSLHVKCTQLRLDISSYLSSVPLDACLAIRLRCCSPKGSSAIEDFKTVEIPIVSLAELVQKNGMMELTGKKTAVLFKYGGESITTECSIVPNPILVGELFVKGKTQDGSVAAEFEVPVFDYVLVDGHLSSAWYPLMSNDSSRSLMTKLGEVRMEIQFLPVLTTPPPAVQSKSDPIEKVSGVCLFGIAIKQITDWTRVACCTVAVELLGCSVETKPSVLKTKQKTELCWNEVLDIAVPKVIMKSGLTSAIMRVEVRDAADAATVYGSCNWLVASELFAHDGSLAATSGDIVVPVQLPAGLDKNSRGKPSVTPPELTFQLVQTENFVPRSVEATRRRRGLFYIQIAEGGSSNSHDAKAVLVSASEVEQLLRESEAPWIELTNSERRVVALHADTTVEAQSLVVLSNDSKQQSGQVSIGVLDGKVLSSIVKTPATETLQRLLTRFLKIDSKDSIPSVACNLMYLEAMHGQLQLQLNSVHWVSNQTTTGKSPGTFRLELRLLSGISQRWVSSPLAFWSRTTNEIVWRTGKNEITVSYSNADEQSEPALQLVLVEVTDSNTPRKEAFGQITVLSAIVAGASGDDTWIAGTAGLTLVGSAMTNTTVQLSLRLRFVREQFSFEELEAKLAVEQEKKALELAEGTATLKKAFAVMGGDEHTPIAITVFMDHVKMTAKHSDDNGGDGALHALEVLQHAADIETDGDLDRLFALMDINGDGQISWDEYAEHMQNVHALANAAATQSIQRQADVTRGSPTDTPFVESEHSDEDDSNEEDRHVEEHDDDSDLDDGRITEIPVKPMQATAGAQGIQDNYKFSPPSGESTKEGGMTSTKTSAERPQVAKAIPNVTNQSEPPPSKVEKPPVTRASRSSPQPTEQRREEVAAVPKTKLPLLSTYVLDWKVDEVVQWMEHEMELSQYTHAIHKNAINGKLLLTLRDEELESELGVTAVLHKRKIMNQIREFQERFQYPPPESVPFERKRPSAAQKSAPAAFVTAAMVSETPAFIKREQLVFQEKQRAKQVASENAYQPKTLGQSRLFPTKTRLVGEEITLPRSMSPAVTRVSTISASNNRTETNETFDDAMQDIFEVIHPDSPDKPPVPATKTPDPSQPMPRLPLIRIGSVTNTDELFEIVRQRIHQLSQLLMPMSNEHKETWSDFGDDPDDDDGDQKEPPNEEQTGLHHVYNAFRTARPSASIERISRLKFQEGMASLLSIEVSWHQFDLLFRRLDVDGDSELCWDEFHHVFTRKHISFESEDLLVLQNALVDVAMARLESQQWTLSDLFKAFDRDGGGTVSIAEFATLVRFLFTSSIQVKRFQQQAKHKISKRHVYLLMSCLDVSADRRISHQEFLRFFFIVWSSKLMQVQDQLLEFEAAASHSHSHEDDDELVSILRQAKRTLRRALRTNFSRPFRDAIRCLDVSVPGPFSGLLTQLQLTTDTLIHADPPIHHGQLAISQERAAHTDRDASLQVWQVLRGQTGESRRDPQSLTRLRAAREQKAREVSRLRVQNGKNQVQRTRLTRQREPSRDNAVLQTPSRHVALDADAMLKFDFRPLN